MLKDNIHLSYSKSRNKELEYGRMFNSENFTQIKELIENENHGGQLETTFFTDQAKLQMNPLLKGHISARLDKVCQQTE